MSEERTDERVEPKSTPVNGAPLMGSGNKPIDGGAYTFSGDEMEEFLGKEPGAAKWFRKWIGGPEFLRGSARHFLYLKGITPEELSELPEAAERIRQVEEFRSTSKNPEVLALAERAAELAEENVPDGPFLVIPTIASDRRSYVPMGILDGGTLAGITLNVVPDAGLYELGVLESSPHMMWMRANAEKSGDDYKYDADRVYNTFPWPEPTEEQRAKIEQTAQGILDARAKLADRTLASLYDDRTMPEELLAAHRSNDAAVLEAYGLSEDAPGEDVLALLRDRYNELGSK